MCLLLGMNSAEPTDFVQRCNFPGFRKWGGETDRHADGWGLALFHPRTGHLDTLYLDPQPCAFSPLADELCNAPTPRTTNMMIAHLRLATQGATRGLTNIHPFVRQMWGFSFCFAHNGDVPKYKCLWWPTLGHKQQHDDDDNDDWFRPVGDTDSEAIFCYLLNRLLTDYGPTTPPSMSLLYQSLHEYCQDLTQRDDGGAISILNFLLSVGNLGLFAYSWPGKRPGSKVWNGLHFCLGNTDKNKNNIGTTTTTSPLAVISTKPLPLHSADWVEFQRHQLIFFHQGVPHYSARDCQHLDMALTKGQVYNRHVPSWNHRHDSPERRNPFGPPSLCDCGTRQTPLPLTLAVPTPETAATIPTVLTTTTRTWGGNNDVCCYCRQQRPKRQWTRLIKGKVASDANAQNSTNQKERKRQENDMLTLERKMVHGSAYQNE